MSTVSRIDFYDMNQNGPLEQRFKKTDEGFLKGQAIVTNVGVFTYVQQDGTIQRELRPPEEVFAFDSINSLKLAPITNDHPIEKVTAENIKALQVGSSGDSVSQDSYHLSIPIVITDKRTVEDAENGKRSLSCGYSVNLDKTPGNWMGMDYDVIQRDIRYNHIAVVDKGRAGDAVVMKLDGLSDVAIAHHDSIDFNTNDGGNNMSLKNFKIDGVEYQAEADVIKHVTKLTNDNKVLVEKLDAVEKESKADSSKTEAILDQLKEDKKELQEKLDAAQKSSPEEIKKRVDERLVLLGAASIAEVEVKEDMDDLAVKKAIITKLSPDSAEKVDKADGVYIDARFDVALEKLEEMKSNKDKLDIVLKGDALGNEDKSKRDSSSARADMMKAASEAWKKKKGGE